VAVAAQRAAGEGNDPRGTSPISWERNREDVDFSAGTVIADEETIEQAGERLYRLVLDLASGSMTKTETIDYRDSLQMYLLDLML
jgi:altronate dehydratase